MLAYLMTALLFAPEREIDLSTYATANVVGEVLVLARPNGEVLMANACDVRIAAGKATVFASDALVLVENGEYVFSWVDKDGVTCTFRQPCTGLTQEECWKKAKAGRALMQRDFPPRAS